MSWIIQEVQTKVLRQRQHVKEKKCSTLKY